MNVFVKGAIPLSDANESEPSKFTDRDLAAFERQTDKLKEHNLARGEREQGTKFKGICFHCRNHFAYRAAHMNEPLLYCQAKPTQAGRAEPMPLNVLECSDYHSVTEMDLRTMAQLAWVIDPRDHLKDGYR